MIGDKSNQMNFIGVIFCICAMTCPIEAQEAPKATIQAAIKAHGGQENLAKIVIGSIAAKGTTTLPGDFVDSFSWEETFELPRRYHRTIKGQHVGKDFTKDFSLEYAVTDGSGWIRQDGGAAREYKGEKLPLQRSWNAFLTLLPSCLADGVKLEAAGNEKVDGREAVGVKIQGDIVGSEAIFFFDKKSGLLVKSKRRIQHPLSREEVEGEVVYSDFKEVSGVQYPRRIITYVAGKKAGEMEITRIEFLKKIDDGLFDKP